MGTKIINRGELAAFMDTDRFPSEIAEHFGVTADGVRRMIKAMYLRAEIRGTQFRKWHRNVADRQAKLILKRFNKSS